MFLSVIIPVYNVEPYLSQCLDSLLATQFLDYEVLLVIGNSTDHSNDICQKYESSDTRIRILRQDKTGLSNARNCGLRAASGLYIMYMDSDDYLDTHAFDQTIKKLYEQKKQGFEVLISDFLLADASGQVYDCRKQIEETEEFITDYGYLHHFLSSRKNFCNVWRYLYLRNFLLKNNLFSKEDYKSEDLDYSTRVLLSIKKCCFYHNPYYCYRVRRSGSLVNVVTMQNVDNLLEIICECVDHVKNNTEFPYGQLLINKLIWEYFFNFLYIEDIVPENDKELAKKKIYDKMYLLKEGDFGRLFYFLVRIGGVSFWAKLLGGLRYFKRHFSK